MRNVIGRAGGVAALVACCGALAIGCGDSGDGGSGADGDTIEVAILTEASGPFEPVFTGFSDGANAYFDQLNAAGGIDGRKIEASIYDAKSDPTQAIQAAKRVVTDGNFGAVIGTGHDPLDVINTGEIPSTGWAVTPGWRDKPWLFPYAGPKSSNTTDAFIRFFTEQGIDKLAILASTDGGSTPVGEQWVQMAKDLGAEVVFQDLGVPSSGGDKAQIGADVQRIRSSGAEGIVSAMGNNTALLPSLLQAGVKAKVLLATGYNDAFAKSMGDAMVGVQTAIDFSPPQATNIKGVDQYRAAMEKYAPGKPLNELSAIGYINARLLADGLRGAADDLTQENVRKFLSTYKTEMDGLVQPISFPEFQREPAPCLAIMQWTGSGWRQVSQKPFICSE